MKMLQLLRQREVGQTVTVVRQEFFFPVQIFLDCLQAHSDVGADSGIGEGDAPVVNVTVQQLQILGSAAQDEIIRSALVVIEEIVFDGIGAMSQAKNEILVPEVSVVL